MTHIAIILLSALLHAVPAFPVAEDSLKFAALGQKLDEYCLAIQGEPIPVQESECDFLIDSCTDSLVRQYVAANLYKRYFNSRLMGAESVAIHILDKWFIPGKVRFKDELELLNARIFADFNRQSLIGMKAGETVLQDRAGEPVTLFGPEASDRFQVLFFYDTECSKCKVESILLRSLLENEDFPVRFYAVYSGTDRQSWEKFIDGRFVIEPVSASVRHLWDPEGDSDFQRKFGVIQTPRLFLIAPDNTVIGRSLDAKSLAFMLHGIFEERELEYGTPDAMAAMDGIFGDGTSLSAAQVKEVADHMASSTLPKGDTLMFRQMTGDLLYYLASRRDEGSHEGMKYLIDNYIDCPRNVWRTPGDSLRIIGLANVMGDLLSKAEPGTRIAELNVPGELMDCRRTRHGEWKLSRLPGKRNIIIFYTEGCAICDAQKAAAKEIIAQAKSPDRSLRREARRTRVLTVNVDEIMSSSPQLAASMFDSFDLSALPYTVIADSKGIIQRRYVSLTGE